MSTTTTSRIPCTRTNANIDTAPRSWLWPLPRLDGAAPCILPPPCCRPELDGVAIGYSGRSSSPSLVPVFAAQDGVIAHAGTTSAGATLSIDHEDGWSTHYAELEHLLARSTDRSPRRRRERVRAGDVIGHACRSTLRVRFGLSRLTGGVRIAQDLAGYLSTWSILPWFGEPITPRAAV